MLKKISEYFLYLTVFLLPLQTRWIILSGELNGGYFEYGSISLYAIDIILLVMLFLISGKNILKKIKSPDLEIKTYWWILAVVEFSVLISVIFSSNKLISFYAYVKFLLGMWLFSLLLNLNYNRLKLLYFFLSGIFFQALLGVWQFLSQSSFANKWLGMAEHDPSVLGASVIETMDGTRWLRAYGGLDHPNVLGGFLVIGMMLVLNLIIKKKESKVIDFIVLNSLFFIFFLSLFFTFSRGAWLAFLAGIGGMLLLSVARNNLLIQKRLLQLILATGISFFVLFNIYGDLVSTRLSGNARLEVKSNMERIESFQIVKQVLKENLFFGVGIGNYPLAVEENYIKGEPAYFYQPVHNVFLLILSEIGVIGSLFFVGFLLYIFYSLCAKDFENSIYLMALPLSMVLMFTVDHWWWSSHFGILLLWFVFGLIIDSFKKNEPIN